MTVRVIWDWWFDELSTPVDAQIGASRHVQDDFAYKVKLDNIDFFTRLTFQQEIALAGGGSSSELIRIRFEQKYTVQGWKVLTVEEVNHSAVAEGNFLSLFDPEYRNQSFARAMYGLSMTVPYKSKSKMHQKKLQEAQPSKHYRGKNRKELRDTPIWKIHRVSAVFCLVLEGEYLRAARVTSLRTLFFTVPSPSRTPPLKK